MLRVLSLLVTGVFACGAGPIPSPEPGPGFVVSRCGTAPDPVAANQELVDLRHALEGWLAQETWPSLRGDPCPALSSRLAQFEERFGLEAQRLPGWVDLAATAGLATRLVEVFVECGLEPSRYRMESGWSGTRWAGARAILLEVAGRPAEAHELLFGDDVELLRCCEFHRQEDTFNLARSRAESLDRAGASTDADRQYREAFQALGDARMEADFGHERPAFDLMLAGYALLLSRAGKDADVVGVLGELQLQAPKSPGATVVDTSLEVLVNP